MKLYFHKFYKIPKIFDHVCKISILRTYLLIAFKIKIKL